MKTPNLPITASPADTETDAGTDAMDSGAAADFQEMLQVLMRGAPPDAPDAGAAAGNADPAPMAAEDDAATPVAGSAEPPLGLPLAPALVTAAGTSAVAAASAAATARDAAAPGESAIANSGVTLAREPAPGAAARPVDTHTDTLPARTRDAYTGATKAALTADTPSGENLSAAQSPALAVPPAGNETGSAQTATNLLPLQPAALAPRSGNDSVTPAAIPPRVESPMGSAGWSSEFAQKVVWIAGGKQQSAELHLNPPDLGPLSIRLAIEDDRANAIFHSVHSEVREAIQAALPRLREVLAESGIALGNASVTADSPREGSAFDRRQPPPPYAAAGAAEKAAEDAVAPQHRSTGSGLVNLFA